MNDSVLRGFCQATNWPARYNIGLKRWVHDSIHSNGTEYFTNCECENYTGVLSPEQMIQVEQSKIFIDYIYKNRKKLFGYPTNISYFLDHEPFLIVKILSDSKKGDES